MRQSQPYFSNSLALELTENYGQLRVAGADDGQPLPTVYVKVYAQLKDGQVQFYKDGYTDLRGRFDVPPCRFHHDRRVGSRSHHLVIHLDRKGDGIAMIERDRSAIFATSTAYV